MQTISLTKGKTAIVDDEDFKSLGRYNWQAHENGKTCYATRYDRERGTVYLHREVMGFPPSKVDHKNRDGLDCRRQNLRVATPSHNNANQGKHRHNTSSRFKGVRWEKDRRKWRASIDSRHIGRFENEVDAARAYDEAALKEWGEFACLNFPANGIA